MAGLFLFSSVVAVVAFPTKALAFAGGDGTSDSPWQIATCTQLQQMGYEWTDGVSSDYYVLANDIDCTGVNFDVIRFGEGGGPFNGTFDGDEYTIRNVTMARNESNIGIFGTISSATIENLRLDNITMTTNGDNTGLLVGYATNGSNISNVYITNSTLTNTGESSHMGGLVGRTVDSEVFHAIVDATVTTADDSDSVGGLVGTSDASYFGEVASLGNVDGGYQIGGLVGTSVGGSSYDKAFATGDAIAYRDNVGGLAGLADDTEFIGTYARGNVSGRRSVGGHIGNAGDGTVVGWAYSTGKVTITGVGDSGGLVGSVSDGADIQANTFWDTQTSEINTSNGSGEVGKTTAEMKNLNTYIPFDWNFDDYWFRDDSVNAGYLCQIWYQVCYDAFIGGGNGSDDDNDGITSGVENAAPNNGDGNGDGIADAEQANVASLVSPVSSKYVTLAVDDSCELSGVSIADASSHASQDTAFSYQSGFVNFTATGCDNDEANVQLYYHGVSPDAMTVRKYNPNTNTYFTVASATVAAATAPISGTLVSYTVPDNGDLDTDDADGVIVDPVGLASTVDAAGVGAPNTGYAEAGTMLSLVAAVMGFGLLTIALVRKHQFDS